MSYPRIDNFGNEYTCRGRGTNSLGNRYEARDFGPNAPNLNSFRYSNNDGSWYYDNPDGSKYYNDGKGEGWYKPPPRSPGLSTCLPPSPPERSPEQYADQGPARDYLPAFDGPASYERQCENESDEGSVIERGSVDRESPPSYEISLDGDSSPEPGNLYEQSTEVQDYGGGVQEPQEDAREELPGYEEGYTDGYSAGLDDGYEVGCDDGPGVDDDFADDYDGGDEYYDDY